MIVDDVAWWLWQKGLTNAVTNATPGLNGRDIYGWSLPQKPDVAVVLVEYPGRSDPAARTVADTLPNWEMPRLQFMVRGNAMDYQGTRLRLEKIKQLLESTYDRDLNGTGYNRFTLVSGPMPLPADDQRRPIFVMSFEVMKSYTLVSIP